MQRQINFTAVFHQCSRSWLSIDPIGIVLANI